MLTVRIAAVALLVAAAVGSAARPAWSDLPQQPSGGAQNGGGTISIGAGNDSSTPGSGGGSGGGPGGGNEGGGGGSSLPGCQWIPETTQGPSEPAPAGGYSQGTSGPETFIPPTEAGTWYLESCPTSAAGPGPLVFVPLGAAPGAVITPQQLSVDATNQLTPPPPSVQLSPAADATTWQWVNVPTWAWVPASDWVPLSATASIPGVVVTATATPVQLVVSYFDGGWHTVTCAGAGTPYSDGLASQIDPARPLNAASPSCGWTYQNSSAGQPGELVPVSVRIVYHASWTATGAPGGGNLGTVTSPATSFSVKVAEVQTVIVR